MKPFHYHEDPLYAAVTAILKGQTVTEQTEQLEEASATTTLDNFRSAPEILTALSKLPGVKDHLRKIKAKPYFDDADFVVASKTAVSGALFNSKVKLADLAKAVLADEGDFKKADVEVPENRVIISVGDEAGVRKILDTVKANNAKAPSRDMKVTAQKFVRKDGFKVYITGNTVKAIEPYKKMAEASELLYGETIEESMELDESIKTRIADLLLNLSGSDTSDMIKLAADTFKKNALALSHSVAADKKDEYQKAIKDMYAELLDSKTLTDFEKNGKKLAVQMKAFKEDTAVEEEVSIEEGNGSYNMGTATITAPGNKLNGKQVSIFHKFDDGRLNVQYAKSDKKGDVLNLTLNKGQYKVNESAELEEAYTTKNASVRKVTAMVGEYSNSEMEDLLFSLAELQLTGGNGDNVEQIALGKLLHKAATAWKKRSQFDESYKVGFPLTKKAITVVANLDHDEFEEFLGGMADYFHEFDANDEGISVRVSTQIAVHFEQAYKIWKNR